MSLGDGKVIVPMEAAGQKKNQVILIGHGDEKLFAGIDARLIAGDPSGVKSFGDPHLVRLADGRIVALLWTWDTASERTLPVHRIESRDNGATWSNPEPTDLLAQVPAPLVIGDTLLCAVNVRSAAHGIRLVASLDGGHTWNTSTATQMWDPYKQSATGVVTPIEPDSAASKVWAALEGFTFGIPELAPLGQDAALLSYYATINGILHARACRFTVRRT